jgi:hypothetical protein
LFRKLILSRKRLLWANFSKDIFFWQAQVFLTFFSDIFSDILNKILGIFLMVLLKFCISWQHTQKKTLKNLTKIGKQGLLSL